VLTCRYLRDEAVNGEAAAVYSQHIENEDTVSDGTVWISKSRGLPLRVETNVEGTLRSTRYEYGNVQVPAGVK
jgi:outer membrane lipoprotein-sorting protein